MMMSNRFKAPEWTSLDHTNQRRTQNTATLNVFFSNLSGKVGFSVWYNKEAPEENGRSQRARIAMTALEINRVFTTMRMMAEGKITLESWSLSFKSDYAGQQRLETPRVVAKVIVRRKNGVIGLTIVDGNKKPITFKMLPPEKSFEVVDETGAPPALAECSAMETIAWIDTIQPILTQLVMLKTEEKQKPKKEGQYGNKERNYQSTESFGDGDDDDIPF